MIKLSSKYGYCKISTGSTEYEFDDSFAALTHING